MVSVPDIPTFEEYVDSLGRLTAHVDPTAAAPELVEIKQAAASLEQLELISVESLAEWVEANPTWVPALGLAVGMSQEKLKNTLKHYFDTTGWVTLARTRSVDLIEMLDEQFDLVRLVTTQRSRAYDFGDVLVARAGTRRTALGAGASGRRVEDEIEAIAQSLGLACRTRTRFAGRGGRTAPADLAVLDGNNVVIAVAAKGFDSTGSKLTDAVREVEEMAEVRTPVQFVMVVVDGIGWKSRRADLLRIYRLWEQQSIDGMYSLTSLDRFRHDLMRAASRLGLL